MDEYEADYEDICKPSALGLVLVPGNWNISVATNLCKNFRGEINVITSEENNQKMVDLIKSSDKCRGMSKYYWDFIRRLLL